MSWRIVVVSSNSKLDCKMNYLVIRNEKITKIHLSEISTLVIESTAISLTSYLLSELIKYKIKVIFCDEKRNPQSELLPYYGSHDTSIKIKKQTEWSTDLKARVWTEIVSEKIRNQAKNLKSLNLPYSILLNHLSEIKENDVSNKEALCAKIYFSLLFGKDFNRSQDNNINAALNYGYTILLSAFNREIVKNGYLTQIGIFHDNMFNQFNLASDLMEPFRPLIDKEVFFMELIDFGKEEKMQLVNILNKEVKINDKKQILNNAIPIYVKSVFNALNEKDISELQFYSNEL